MALPDFYGRLTLQGEVAQADALSNNTNWALQTMCVGDGQGSGAEGTPVPEKNRTTLVHERDSVTLNKLYKHPQNPGQIIAEGILPPEMGGWWVREVGLKDENGKLLVIANCPPSFKPLLAAGSGRVQVLRITFRVTDPDSLVLMIDPSTVVATVDWAESTFLGIDDTAVAAYQLATARTISATGDFTGQWLFDGSKDVSATMTLRQLTLDDLPDNILLTDAPSQIVAGDLTIAGNFFVQGETVKVDSQISTADRIIVLNDGEQGSGITGGFSGVEVDRGSAQNYYFGFSETANEFVLGKDGGLQSVATRETTPTNGAMQYWDAANKRLASYTVNGAKVWLGLGAAADRGVTGTGDLMAVGYSGINGSAGNLLAVNFTNIAQISSQFGYWGSSATGVPSPYGTFMAVRYGGQNAADRTMDILMFNRLGNGEIRHRRLSTAGEVFTRLLWTSENLLDIGTTPASARESIGLELKIAGDSGAGVIAYNGRTKAPGALYGGPSNPTDTTRLNYDGYLYVTRGYFMSSIRYKNIQHVVSPNESLKKVVELGGKGVSVGKYKKTKGKKDILHRWLIAEDVVKHMPEAVSLDDKGRPDSVDYTSLIPDLYAAIAAQQQQLNTQNEQIVALQKQLGGEHE